jgi:hypothetical protein
MRFITTAAVLLITLSLALLAHPAGFAQETDELTAHLANVRRQVEDASIPIELRERLAQEMASTLDRAAQSAKTAANRRARWSEAIALLDEFRANNRNPRSHEFAFQAAVYVWARAQSWSQQWESLPTDTEARTAAIKDLDQSIERFKAIPMNSPEISAILEENLRFRLAQALADRARFDPDPSQDRQQRETEALEILKSPFTETSLQGFVAVLRGTLLDRLGRIAEARKVLDTIPKTDHPPPAALVLEARTAVLLHQKEFDEALKGIDNAVVDDLLRERLAVRVRLVQRATLPPGSERNMVESDLFHRAGMLRKSGKPIARQALMELAQGLADPGPGASLDAWEMLAQGWVESGDRVRAAAIESQGADRALALGQPEKAAAFRLRGGALLYQAGEFAQADRLLSLVADDASTGPLRPKAGLLRAMARGQAVALKKPGASRTAYVAALQAQLRDFPNDPTASEARWLLGKAQLEALDLEHAQATWSAIPPNDPHWLDARLALARLHRSRLEDLHLINDRAQSNEAIARAREFLTSTQRQVHTTAEQTEIDLELARLDLTPGVGRTSEALQICERILQSPIQADLRARARRLHLVALASLNRFLEAETLARDEVPKARPVELLETVRILNQIAMESQSELRLRRFGLMMQILIAPALYRKEALTPEQRSEAQLLQARALAFTGDDMGARKALSSWTGQSARSPDRVLRDLADLYARLDAFEMVIDVQRLRMRSQPAGSPPWLESRYGLALAYYRSGKPEQARRLIDATAILHPDLGGGTLREKFEHLRQRIGSEE